MANEIIGIDKGPLSIGFCKPHRHICFLFTPPLRNCCGTVFPDISMCLLNGNFCSNLCADMNAGIFVFFFLFFFVLIYITRLVIVVRSRGSISKQVVYNKHNRTHKLRIKLCFINAVNSEGYYTLMAYNPFSFPFILP